MKRSVLGLLLVSSLVFAQATPSNQDQEPIPPARTASADTTEPGTPSDSGDSGKSPTQPVKRARSRRVLGFVGVALVGTGIALVKTSQRTHEVPAVNCSFYPDPFIPCVPAHTDTTRSQVQDGIGAAALIGGIVTIYVWIGSR